MVADAEIVRDRLARIQQYVGDLRAMSDLAEPAFLQNRERQYAVRHALQLAIEASVEIATHICAADALGIPASYAEAFDLLERAAIVDAAVAEDLRRSGAIPQSHRAPVWACRSATRAPPDPRASRGLRAHAVAIEQYLGGPGPDAR